jgi:hypothetical protein
MQLPPLTSRISRAAFASRFTSRSSDDQGSAMTSSQRDTNMSDALVGLHHIASPEQVTVEDRVDGRLSYGSELSKGDEKCRGSNRLLTSSTRCGDEEPCRDTNLSSQQSASSSRYSRDQRQHDSQTTQTSGRCTYSDMDYDLDSYLRCFDRERPTDVSRESYLADSRSDDSRCCNADIRLPSQPKPPPGARPHRIIGRVAGATPSSSSTDRVTQ